MVLVTLPIVSRGGQAVKKLFCWLRPQQRSPDETLKCLAYKKLHMKDRKGYRVPQGIVTEWRCYAESREGGPSLWRIAGELAGQSPHAQKTIYSYLNPEAREHYKRLDLRSYHHKAQWAKTKRKYERAYRRLTRPSSQRRLLSEVFESRSEASLEEITQAVRESLEGVRFKHATIEKRFLRAYMEEQRANRIRGPPLYEVKPGLWRYGTEDLTDGPVERPDLQHNAYVDQLDEEAEST